MENKDKRKKPCYRSQGAGLKVKMIQSFKLERSLVFCCKTQLQKRLKEEGIRREALQEELRDQKIIIEELVQQYIQLEDGLTLKFEEFAAANTQKLQALENEKQQLLDQISDQKQTTHELFEKLTEERLKNLNLKEQLDQKPSCQQGREIQKLEKTVHVLQNALSEEQEHKERELRVQEESIRELNQKLCEEKNTVSLLEKQLQQKVRGEEDAVQTKETINMLLLELNEEKQNNKQVESRLKGKEEYIRLLKRDLCEREALFKSHLRLVSEKMEAKSAACRELREQLKQERENSEGLELLSVKLMDELDKQMMEQLREQPAPAQKSHWKQVCSRLTPDIYRRWARKRKNQKISEKVEEAVEHMSSLQTCMD